MKLISPSNFEESSFDYLIGLLRGVEPVKMNYLNGIEKYFLDRKEEIKRYERTNGIIIDLTTPNVQIRTKKVAWKQCRYLPAINNVMLSYDKNLVPITMAASTNLLPLKDSIASTSGHTRRNDEPINKVQVTPNVSSTTLLINSSNESKTTTPLPSETAENNKKLTVVQCMKFNKKQEKLQVKLPSENTVTDKTLEVAKLDQTGFKRHIEAVQRKSDRNKRPRLNTINSVIEAKVNERPVETSSFSISSMPLSPLVPSSDSSIITSSSECTITSRTSSTMTNGSSSSAIMNIKEEFEDDLKQFENDDVFFDQCSESSDINEDTAQSTEQNNAPIEISEISVLAKTDCETSVLSFSSGHSTSNTHERYANNNLILKEEPVDAPTQVLFEPVKTEIKSEECDDNYDGDASTDPEDLFDVVSEVSDDENITNRIEAYRNELINDPVFKSNIGDQEPKSTANNFRSLGGNLC